MRLIAVSRLKAFWAKYPDSEQPLRSWFYMVQAANWKKPTDITAQFTTASVLKSRRVVFNIKGNDYRLVVAVAYKLGVVYVKFIGTHRQYDRIDADNVEME
jgi:mRNA interferase HigB